MFGFVDTAALFTKDIRAAQAVPLWALCRGSVVVCPNGAVCQTQTTIVERGSRVQSLSTDHGMMVGRKEAKE